MNRETLEKIKTYLKLPTGYYLADNGTVGDVYGPMGPGRFINIENFYHEHKNDIDNADQLLKEHEDKVSYFKQTFCPKNKSELYRYIEDKQRFFGDSVDLNNIDTHLITDMSYLFQNKRNFGDISNWDVSNVEDMSYMFSNATPFSKFNISNWNVSKVKNMQGMFMFSGCQYDLSKWDVSNVKDMSKMFMSSSCLSDISNWDVSNVENMSHMFRESTVLGSISKMKISAFTDQTCIFYKSKFVGAFDKWDNGPCPKDREELENILAYRFKMHFIINDNQFICDLNDIDVHLITDMSYLFACKKNLNIDISKWVVSDVTDFSDMFNGSDFNGDISCWDIQKDAKTDRMFDNCPIIEKHKPCFGCPCNSCSSYGEADDCVCGKLYEWVEKQNNKNKN